MEVIKTHPFQQVSVLERPLQGPSRFMKSSDIM